MQITQFMRRAVQTNGNGIATRMGERTHTWHQFAGRCARLAGALTGLGLVKGDRVGILALNSDRYLEAFFGLASAGIIFVPINTRLAPPEMEFWLADSGCVGLLVDDAFAAVLPAIRGGTPELRHVIHIGDGPTPAGALAYEPLLANASPAADAGATTGARRFASERSEAITGSAAARVGQRPCPRRAGIRTRSPSPGARA